MGRCGGGEGKSALTPLLCPTMPHCDGRLGAAGYTAAGAQAILAGAAGFGPARASTFRPQLNGPSRAEHE